MVGICRRHAVSQGNLQDDNDEDGVGPWGVAHIENVEDDVKREDGWHTGGDLNEAARVMVKMNCVPGESASSRVGDKNHQSEDYQGGSTQGDESVHDMARLRGVWAPR